MFRASVFVLFAAALVAGQADETNEAVPQSEITADDIDIFTPGRGNPCSVSGTTASCCAKVGIKKIKINANTCLSIQVDVNRMAVAGSLSVNGKQLLKQDLLSATNWCVSLPPPASFLKGCLNIRHVQVNAPGKMVDICTGISVSNLVGVKFDCIRFANGKLSTHREH